jgi:hypothetical protein
MGYRPAYAAGGSGPTEIRSSPGARPEPLNTRIVFAPATSGTATAVVAGTPGLPAAVGTSMAVAPLTLTDSEPAVAAGVWSSWSR